MAATMMFKKTKPIEVKGHISQFPHCDQRVLHAPLECTYCDLHPEWQQLRQSWGIAFTGWEPSVEEHELPCPATYARGESLNAWHGNRAASD